MNVHEELSVELLGQHFDDLRKQGLLEQYKAIAMCYASTEQCIAVLSDMQENRSYVYCGKLNSVLHIPFSEEDSTGSIWEDALLGRVHTDDLYDKYLYELKFLHCMKQLKTDERSQYCFVGKLRVSDDKGEYHWLLHRIFYVYSADKRVVRLALCLYNPLVSEQRSKGMAVNMLTGNVLELENETVSDVLSKREIEVLRLISQGMQSKNIAEKLFISINTVNRHRQEILRKLQVRNAVEACRVAKELRLL